MRRQYLKAAGKLVNKVIVSTNEHQHLAPLLDIYSTTFSNNTSTASLAIKHTI